MLVKSINLMKSNIIVAPFNNKVLTRLFSSRVFSSGDLGSNFSFPKHKEFFNDKYYDTESEPKSPYSSTAPGPNAMSEDYQDPNNPFLS